MTLLEYNKKQQEYLYALQKEIQNVYTEWSTPAKNTTWDIFTLDTQNTILGTLELLQDKIRSNAKYYNVRERIKKLTSKLL